MTAVTVAFSIHRPEILPLLAERMRRCDAIFLEEPATPGFAEMLAGETAIDDYLMGTDMEFPEFSRRSCELFRELYGEGRLLFQVEPFIEELLEIHEFLSDGNPPDAIARPSVRFDVYEAERIASGALLHYYETTGSDDFREVVDAVKRFARADAARFLLRDRMRAGALAAEIPRHERVLVEAGEIHFTLWRELRRALPAHIAMKPLFITGEIAKPIWGRRHAFGPGDLLTLLYAFHPDTRHSATDLLAARSVLYSKLLRKTETAPPDIGHAFPHIVDETETIRIVEKLSLTECNLLYPHIRMAGSAAAKRVVMDYLSRRGRRLG